MVSIYLTCIAAWTNELGVAGIIHPKVFDLLHHLRGLLIKTVMQSAENDYPIPVWFLAAQSCTDDVGTVPVHEVVSCTSLH